MEPKLSHLARRRARNNLCLRAMVFKCSGSKQVSKFHRRRLKRSVVAS